MELQQLQATRASASSATSSVQQGLAVAQDGLQQHQEAYHQRVAGEAGRGLLLLLLPPRCTATWHARPAEHLMHAAYVAAPCRQSGVAPPAHSHAHAHACPFFGMHACMHARPPPGMEAEQRRRQKRLDSLQKALGLFGDRLGMQLKPGQGAPGAGQPGMCAWPCVVAQPPSVCPCTPRAPNRGGQGPPQFGVCKCHMQVGGGWRRCACTSAAALLRVASFLLPNNKACMTATSGFMCALHYGRHKHLSLHLAGRRCCCWQGSWR